LSSEAVLMFRQGSFFEEQYEDWDEFIAAWEEAKAAAGNISVTVYPP